MGGQRWLDKGERDEDAESCQLSLLVPKYFIGTLKSCFAMTATIELNSARRKLQGVLGEAQKDYFFHLKNWFRKRISKEEFDNEARRLLPVEHCHLHNAFLLAILNKCQTLANFAPTPSKAGVAANNDQAQQYSPAAGATVAVAKKLDPTMIANSPEMVAGGGDRLRRGKVKRRTKSSRAGFDQRFQPADTSALSSAPVLDSDQPVARSDGRPYDDERRLLRLCRREETLPDAALLHGRLLVAAWEKSLSGVDETAVELLLKAVEDQLRLLVTALVMRRRGFRTREGRFFPHSFGVQRPNPWLLNTERKLLESDSNYCEETSECSDQVLVPPPPPMMAAGADIDPLVPATRPTSTDADQRALFEVACGSGGFSETPRRKINTFDLFHLLRERKSLVPCHSVYALNIERVSARMSHSGHDD